VLTALQSEADAAGRLDWKVSVDSTVARVHQHGATAKRAVAGSVLSGKSLAGGTIELEASADLRDEPENHGIGRSRGGLTTKAHALVDGGGLPLVILIGPAQGGDSPMLGPLLANLRVPRQAPGRPRTTPDALLSDKAYSARAHRAHLRARGITTGDPRTVRPDRAPQAARLRRRRPVDFDAEAYRGRNVVERAFNKLKNWRAIPTRYDKHAINYGAGVVLGAVVLWLRHLGDTP
jgi:transposase